MILLLFDRAHEQWAHCWAAMVLGGKAQLCNLKPSPSYNLTNHFDTTPAPHCNPRATLQRTAMRGNTLSICSITLKTLQRSPNAHQLGPKHFPYAKGQEELNVKVIWGSTWKLCITFEQSNKFKFSESLLISEFPPALVLVL